MRAPLWWPLYARVEFGATVGMLIHTHGMRLTEAANTPADAGAP
jgi:hypothetical protein